MTWHKAGDVAAGSLSRYSTQHWHGWKKEDARRYIDDVTEGDAFPCKNGHGGCALWDNGPCAAEVQAWFDLSIDGEDDA